MEKFLLMLLNPSSPSLRLRTIVPNSRCEELVAGSPHVRPIGWSILLPTLPSLFPVGSVVGHTYSFPFSARRSLTNLSTPSAIIFLLMGSMIIIMRTAPLRSFGAVKGKRSSTSLNLYLHEGERLLVLDSQGNKFMYVGLPKSFFSVRAAYVSSFLTF